MIFIIMELVISGGNELFWIFVLFVTFYSETSHLQLEGCESGFRVWGLLTWQYWELGE